jgi:hypothetical protein
MIAPVTSRAQTSDLPSAGLTVGALLRRAAADHPDRDATRSSSEQRIRRSGGA